MVVKRLCLVCRRPRTPAFCPGCGPGLTHNDPEYRRNRVIVLEQSDVCWRCGKPGADTADHVTPLVAGGTHALGNLRPAHSRCNTAKGGN